VRIYDAYFRTSGYIKMRNGTILLGTTFPLTNLDRELWEMGDSDDQREAAGVANMRWRVEKMQVDEDTEKASTGQRFRRVKKLAREGWRKVQNFLDRKRLVVERGTGRVLVKEG
jgi:hypothetical protein